MDAVLELDNLSKSYGSRAVLRSVTLSVPRATIVGFFGLNGAGKSTTNRIILGFARPTSGECRLLGQPQGDPRALARLGYLSENPYFHEYLTGIEVLDYAGRLHRLGASDRRRRIEEVLQLVRLQPEAGGRFVREYSKGMRQRLGLAQALIHQPDFLLLDEPFTGLDPTGRAMLKAVMRDFRARGGTIFFSSHQLLDAQEICDRAAILHEGRLVADAPLTELEGREPGKTLEQIFLSIVGAGAESDRF